MSAIDHLLREPAARAIGWALLHFLWQGALVGALTAIVLACLRKGAADIRYVVSAIGLSLMLTLPAVTAVQLWRSDGATLQLTEVNASWAQGPISSERIATREAPRDTIATAPTAPLVDSLRIERWLPMLVLTWIAGVLVLSLRLLSGWLWVQRMKTHGTSLVEDGWDLIGTRLCRRLHISRTVRLLRSTLVEVPTVIGWLKPVILLPASALAGLNPHQLEAILAHELAHIRRHDYLVNLLQTVVETLLFYHPAVWWLSRRIRTERENCCDDLAVSLCGDPLTYAQALADLEGLRSPRRRFALAANGGSLAQRVRRLLGAPNHAGRAPGWLAGGATVIVLLGIAVGAAGTDTHQSTATESTARSVQPGSTAPSTPTVTGPSAPVSATPSATTPTLRVHSDPMNRGHKPVMEEAEVRQLLADRTAMLAAEERALIELPVPMLASTHTMLAIAPPQTLATIETAHIATTRPIERTLGSIAAIALSPSQTHGTYSWSNNGEKLEVRYEGEVEFTDDDTDVKRLSPGGSLRIRDGGMMTSLLGGHTVEFTADSSGNIRRRFWVGSTERPFDPEGRKWVASMLPRFIRQSGIGATARVARILKQKGPGGVLAEISLIEGSWAKRRYFSELLKSTQLDPATIRQLLVQAGREIDSDFELASLLIDNAGTLLVDDASRQAYFNAAASIDSDFEMHRVFSAVIKRGTVSPSLLASLLAASRKIDSDFEEASLLVDVAKLQSLDNTTRPAFFSALDTVQSDFEHHRVLSALGTRSDLPPDTVAAMLTSGASVSSDFEAASFLIQIAKQQAIEGDLRTPFFRAVDSIDSAFERGRVLKAVAERSDASAETILAVLRAAKGVNSSHEASQVLLAVAASHPVAGSARDAYIDAAEKLGDFEQGRALAALVKNERRK